MKLIITLAILITHVQSVFIGRSKEGNIKISDSKEDLVEIFQDGTARITEIVTDNDHETFGSSLRSVSTESAPYQWGLDRIDQYMMPLDKKPFVIKDPTQDCGKTKKEICGEGVHIYVVDTGVSDHNEFEDRLLKGWTVHKGKVTKGADDDNGHGTHVASTIAGKQVGVAKCANIIPVKVLDKHGNGKFSDIIKGIQSVLEDIKEKKYKTTIVNMSLGGGYFAPMNEVANELSLYGAHVVVAAGNSYANSCAYSPASAELVTTVAATDSNDNWASFSNWNKCVDVSAPGVDIYGASTKGNNKYTKKSGTSMASPHVAGAMAIHLTRGMNGTFVNEYTNADRIYYTPRDTQNLLLHIADFQSEEDFKCRLDNSDRLSMKRKKHICKTNGCEWIMDSCSAI